MKTKSCYSQAIQNILMCRTRRKSGIKKIQNQLVFIWADKLLQNKHFPWTLILVFLGFDNFIYFRGGGRNHSGVKSVQNDRSESALTAVPYISASC